MRWAPGQTLFQYASVRASCQTTPLNSCSPTANKTVLFASGFWPWAVSTALLPAGTGAYSRPLTPTGRPELARGSGGHPQPPPHMGRAPSSHIPLHLAPSTAKHRVQRRAGTPSFILGASDKPPLRRGGHVCLPPAGSAVRGRVEERVSTGAGGGNAALAPSAAWLAAATLHV